MMQRNGLTLIEVIFAVTLSAAAAALTISYLRLPGDSAKDRACELRREVLAEQVARYQDITGATPGRDLRELQTSEYAGNVLPTCPSTGMSYRYIGGQVQCPSHP
ncbi:hypothetical protein V7x_51880 [Crateriforma conspicua]|nr:hypothetical protein Mal65_02890 [Crateriforma conspicua]TWU63448.1 hypothetical protein V7x_51880 [Crateriforma conspicua]